VATYPPVTNRECEDALARITVRHGDDSRWSEAGTEPRDVLAYLRRRHLQLPRKVAQRDVWDELVLSAWVYWDERRRELELLRRAGRYGLSLTELGRYLGIGTRQGMRDYLDRLEALISESPPHATPPHATPPPADDPGQVALREARARDPRRRPPPGVATSFVGRSRALRDADVHAQRGTRARALIRPSQQDWIDQHAPRVGGRSDFERNPAVADAPAGGGVVGLSLRFVLR